MWNIGIQAPALDSGDGSGLDDPFHLPRLKDGVTVGHSDTQFVSHLTSDRTEAQILEPRYGIIRARALTPRKSLACIEKLPGET